MAQAPIMAAHEESRSALNGIGIVKLMGRESGFIALHASTASGDVNLLLLPEMEFNMDEIMTCVFFNTSLYTTPQKLTLKSGSLPNDSLNPHTA